MLRADMTGWTSNVYDMEVKQKTGADGKPYESKTIYFVLATHRGYTSRVVNNQIVKDNVTDFVFCRAHGKLAEVIKQYCSDKDQKTGKIVSRKLSLWGHMESYVKEEEYVQDVKTEQIIAVPMPDGTKKNFKVPFTVKAKVVIPATKFVFVVREMEIQDSKKNEPSGVITAEIGAITEADESYAEAITALPVDMPSAEDIASASKANAAGNPDAATVTSVQTVKVSQAPKKDNPPVNLDFNNYDLPIPPAPPF